jgi:CheY-like chemotaxis protein
MADAAGARPLPAPLPSLVVNAEELVPDDRADISPDDSVLLIVDDDPHDSRVLLGLARDKGFKGIIANRGASALVLAKQYLPTAITLDVFLPDMLGWTVLNNLKLDPATRHIPVQMLSVEEERQHGLSHGAFSYLVKPGTTQDLENAFERIKSYVVPHKKRLLVVEDNDIERQGIVELLMHDDIEVAAVSTGSEALAVLSQSRVECCVLDLKLPDMTGFELLERIQEDGALRDTPVVVFTGKELTEDEESKLRTVAKSVVLKDVQSPERLFDETALFLHRVIADLPPSKRRLLEHLHDTDEVLIGKHVLVVDDDVRNIFALSSVLERHGLTVETASTGQEAIARLRDRNDIALVRKEIEAFALRRSIEFGDDAWEASIVAARHKLALLEKAGKNVSEDIWESRHRDFHRTLVAACQSKALLHLHGLLTDQFDRYRRLSAKSRLPNAPRSLIHQRILDAVLNRNADLAVKLLADHIDEATSLIVAGLVAEEKRVRKKTARA